MSSPPLFEEVILDNLRGPERILDVGAGGEGLVSRIARTRVCAVDIRVDRIREARIYGAPANWIACDARHLCFREGAFDYATMWFSLAYMMTVETKLQVLREVNRVLVRGGHLLILAMRTRPGESEHTFRALFKFPDGTVSQSGYRVRGGQDQTVQSVLRMVESSGFYVTEIDDNGTWFRILSRRE